MGKKLIITEKPSVARDFARVLKVNGKGNGYIENSDYVISWCYGHLVQMVYPEEYDIKYKSWHLEDLPFLPKEYKYGIVQSASSQYYVVINLLHREDIDTVYWAGDSGKEGQTIEENIRNYGGVREGMKELRVWIDSQTDDEIKRGILEAKPMSDYDLLGKSGIMRTIEDYSLGINFSRVLSIKYGKMVNDAAATKDYVAIAIGRVMTCVLGMVVRREREIRDFYETVYFRVCGYFADIKFQGEWKAIKDTAYYESPLLYKENGFKRKDDALKLISKVEGHDAKIVNIEKGTTRKKAPLLFNLAELQAECSKKFKISPAQTLDIIQELYEKKLTTYPRTDARVLTKAVAKEIYKNLSKLSNYDEVSAITREIIDNKLYVGLEKTHYTDDSQVTDHYAIIPTGVLNSLNHLGSLQKKVFDLIVKRFLAIFYPPAEYKTLKIQLCVNGENFFTGAKLLDKAGYMKISGIPQQKESDEESTDEAGCTKEDLFSYAQSLKPGDMISSKHFDIKEGKTQPPKRYTSGTLILAMENAGNLIEDDELRAQIKKSGIGTSATRGDILDKLVRIGYLSQNGKTQIITPDNLGEMVYEVVNLSCPSLLIPEMTASWEKGLEGIAAGTVEYSEYKKKLEGYIGRETIKMAESNLTKIIAEKISPYAGKNARGLGARKKLGVICPDCGGDIVTTPFGYGCSNYNNEEINCHFSIGQIAGVDLSEEDVKDLITNKKTKPINGFTSKSKKKFKAYLILKKNENNKSIIEFCFDGVEPDYVEDVVCPDCNSKIQIINGAYSCSGYKKDDENSCKFYIGKIAGKTLSVTNVQELLKEGKTKTIRGFKSKSGKSFDSVLVLKKTEFGKSEISFDFENVEAKIIKDVKCPVCGGNIIKNSFGYGCSNYNREDPENSCKFSIGTIAGVKLKESSIKELLLNGQTSVISGFKSKKGNKFDAMLTFDKDENGKIKGLKFEFDNSEKLLEGVNCPICGKPIVKIFNGYRCQGNDKTENCCSFFIGKIAGKALDDSQVKSLILTGQTEIISGFLSKKGLYFDAKLKLDEAKKIIFEFDQFQ